MELKGTAGDGHHIQVASSAIARKTSIAANKQTKRFAHMVRSVSGQFTDDTRYSKIRVPCRYTQEVSLSFTSHYPMLPLSRRQHGIENRLCTAPDYPTILSVMFKKIVTKCPTIPQPPQLPSKRLHIATKLERTSRHRRG